MRSVHGVMVVLAASTAFAAWGCGGDERRPARAPARPVATSTTQTTSAALTVTSAQTPATSSPSGNATMAPAATPVRLPVTVETSSAVMKIATSRCDREAACSNIGTGREFGDRDECVNEIGHHVVSVLPSDYCEGGVDKDALDTCVRDLEAEPCGNGAAAVDRLTSCARARLCTSAF